MAKNSDLFNKMNTNRRKLLKMISEWKYKVLWEREKFLFIIFYFTKELWIILVAQI